MTMLNCRMGIRFEIKGFDNHLDGFSERQYGWRNSKADLLCRLEIDDELKLRRLFHG